VLHVANLINTTLADSVSVCVIRAFVEMRRTTDRILDSVIDTEKGTTVKDEALDILKESIK
jgi:hypothetical protein